MIISVRASYQNSRTQQSCKKLTERRYTATEIKGEA